MRFILFDTITNLQEGQSIEGQKSFSLSDEYLHGHFPKMPLIPSVMFIESMAQLLGWLIIYTHGFEVITFLTIIEQVTLPAALRPGFTADIHAEIISTSKRDSLGRAQIYIGGKLIASIERIIYSHSSKANATDLRQLFNYYSGQNSDLKLPGSQLSLG